MIRLFKKKKKFVNSIRIQQDGTVFMGCPCGTLEDGSCIRDCRKISVGIPCIDCPTTATVYIAIALSKEIKCNNLVIRNMHTPVIKLYMGES